MDRTEPPTFGALLRRYRLLAGLSQEALAERAQLSTRAVSALEQRLDRAPRAATLALLADALALSEEARAALVDAAQQSAWASRQAGVACHAEREQSAPLVGRAPELALLEGHVGGAGPPLLLLAGEPGIGKSALLAEAARRGGAAGWQVLQGGCTRGGGQLPYAPLLQALHGHILSLPAAKQRPALRGCAWLVRLLPELAEGPIEPLPSWTVSPEQERRLMFAAVERFLANVAGPAGTLLLLDDLQWAGDDALDLLASLTRATGAPVRLMGVYRDTEVRPADPLAVTLADLAHAGLARQRLLPRLGNADVQCLLDTLLDGRASDHVELSARIALRTGGVPFFVVSCAQMLRDAATVDDAEAIPWSVAQGIRQRLAALPALAREVLSAAAIAVGRTAPAPVLAAVVEKPEGEVLDALEVAWAARLLEDTDGGYRMAHDLIREVLEADLGPARRRVLHRKTAEALEGRPDAAPAEVLAYHYARSDMAERAVPCLEQAGDQACARQGHAAAAGFYQEAVERLDRQGQPLDAARVREKLGHLLRTGARYADALAALEPAAATYRAADDTEALGRVVAQIAGVHTDRGTPGEGLALLEPVLARLAERGPSRVLATLYTRQADLLYMQGRLHEELAATEQGERIAMLAGDEEQRAEAQYLRGGALCCLGRLAEAVATLEGAMPVIEVAGAPWTLSWALTWLSLAHLELGSFVASTQVAERGLQLAERHGFRVATVHLTLWRGWSAFYSGAWAAARRDYEQAAAMDREIGPSFSSYVAPLSLATLCLAEGAEAEAGQHLDASAGLLHCAAGPDVHLRVQCALAEHDLRADRPADARARLASLLTADMTHEEDVTPALPLLANALLDLGDIGEAERVAGQAVARAREQGRQGLLVDALRILALVAIRQGRRPEAAGAVEEGWALARHIGYPYGEARLLHVSGAVLVQIGRPEAARECFEIALALVRQLGAQREVLLLEQELAALSQNSQTSQNNTVAPLETRVTAAHWAAISPLLPRQASTGRPRADDRRTIAAILYKLETGCAWRSIPAAFGAGVTAHRRLQAWQAAGVWDQILAIVRDDSPREAFHDVRGKGEQVELESC